MKKTQIIAALGSFALALASQIASAQTTVVYSETWPSSADGWTTSSPWTSTGFSPSTGWTLTASSGPGYGGALTLPYTQGALTAAVIGMTPTDTISLDVTTPGGSFGYYLQFDLDIYSSSGVYGASLDDYSYQGVSIGGTTQLSWTLADLSPSQLALIDGDPSAFTQFVFQIGGGYTAGNESMTVDDFDITNTVPEPSSMALFGMGAAALLKFARRRIA
jgi:hypothetical protein